MKINYLSAFSVAVLACLGNVSAALECARLFQSDMVIPHGKPVPVWGTAAPKESVSVHFKNKKYSTQADKDGRWQVQLSPMAADAKGAELVISGKTEKLNLENILVGDVWLASGQSNMEWTMNRSSDGKSELPKANNPSLRLFNLKSKLHTGGGAYKTEDYKKNLEENIFDGQWKTTTPENAKDNSAIAYFFGDGLQKELKIPVGIINNAVGGSGTVSWVPMEALKKRPAYASFLGKNWLNSPLMSAWAAGRARQNLSEVMKDETLPLRHPFQPSVLFEEGVRPLSTFPIKGVIWYQGETDAEQDNKPLHIALMSDLISSWRSSFQNETLPFIMVQLPRINDNNPLRAKWPEYREAQEEVAKQLPHVGLACTIDLGSKDSNVHPVEKKPVADRLTAIAASLAYGKKPESSSSITKWETKGDKILLSTNATILKTTDNKAPLCFEIAEENGPFVPAQAVIKGHQILLNAEGVKNPQLIRYAWKTYLEPNLVNEKGLPLFPFRNNKEKRVIPALPLGKFPASGKVKIACVGDSITFGLGIGKQENSYPQTLGRMLGEKFEVKNFGNSGKTAGDYPSQKNRKRWYGDNIEYTQAQEYQPDIIICNLGINDTGAWWDPTLFETGYTTLIKTLKGDRQPTVLVWNKLGPDYRGAKGKKAYPGNNFEKFNFNTQDNKSAFNRPECEKIINKIAKQEKCHTLDAYTPLSDKPEWYKDGLHPNEDGARKIAEITGKWISKAYNVPLKNS